MKRLGVVVVVAAIAAAAVFVTTGDAQRAGEQTLVLIEKEGADFFVDNPPKSKGRTFHVSPGDLAVVRVPLYDEADVRQGTAHVSCIATRGGVINKAVFLCTGTLKLKDGTIGFSTVFVGQSDERIAAVTGGTGAYEGARGSIDSEFGTDGNRIDTVHLLP
jgi:hypothetical protein